MKALLFTFLAFAAQSVFAQGDYPSKPIRLIVPVAAGGNQEITARAVAEEMSKGLGQQIIVEARPSSSALIGTQLVARSAPDGYTLLSVSTTFARAIARRERGLRPGARLHRREPRIAHPARLGYPSRRCCQVGRRIDRACQVQAGR